MAYSSSTRANRESATESLSLSLVRSAYPPPPSVTRHPPLALPPRPKSPPTPKAPKRRSRSVSATTSSKTPAWCYALGTSAGLTAIVATGQYYGHQLFDAEPTADFPPLPQDLAVRPGDPAEPMTPTAVEPEVWGQLIEGEVGLWKQDLQNVSQTLQAKLQGGVRRVLPQRQKATPSLSSQALAQVRTTPDWQQQLAQRTRDRVEQRAHRFLQAAFDRAEKRDFASAIAFLEQVPKIASVRGKAEVKILEYREKRNVQAEYWLYRAKFLAYGGDYAGAIGYLRQIASETSAYREAQQKLAEYIQARNVQADELLNYASNFAAQGKYLAANQILRMIPQEAPAYAIAKDLLFEYSQKMYAASQLEDIRQPS